MTEPIPNPLHKFAYAFEEQERCLSGLMMPVTGYLSHVAAFAHLKEFEVPTKFLEVCARLVQLGDAVEETRRLIQYHLDRGRDVPPDLALAGRAMEGATNAFLEAVALAIFSPGGLPFSYVGPGQDTSLRNAAVGARGVMDMRARHMRGEPTFVECREQLEIAEYRLAVLFDVLLATLALDVVRAAVDRRRHMPSKAYDRVLAAVSLGRALEDERAQLNQSGDEGGVVSGGLTAAREKRAALQEGLEAALRGARRAAEKRRKPPPAAGPDRPAALALARIVNRDKRNRNPRRATMWLGMATFCAMAGADAKTSARQLKEFMTGCAEGRMT